MRMGLRRRKISKHSSRSDIKATGYELGRLRAISPGLFLYNLVGIRIIQKLNAALAISCATTMLRPACAPPIIECGAGET